MSAAEPTPSFLLATRARPALSGSLPLWYQVAQSLRAAVLATDRASAMRLPTEAQLAAHYGVSVSTVRQALASLTSEGLISRHRRRGTFVNPGAAVRPALRVLGSADTVLAQQSGERVRVLGRSVVPASGAAAALPTDGEVVCIRRLRSEHGRPSSYVENFLLPEHAALVDDRALQRAPMTKVLRDELGLSLTRIDNAVSARSATPELAGLLQIAVLSPVLQSDNTTWGRADRGGPDAVVDVARICYPGERFTFAVSVDLP